MGDAKSIWQPWIMKYFITILTDNINRKEIVVRIWGSNGYFNGTISSETPYSLIGNNNDIICTHHPKKESLEWQYIYFFNSKF